MNVHVYKYTCLTNLHVGSGDVNYNIIDNEVERDPVTGMPIIHASGVKGALREHFTRNGLAPETVETIFGAPPKNKEAIKAGTYKFLDARFLSRPMRVGNSATKASVNVVSISALNDYLQLLSAFGCNHYGITQIDAIGDDTFGDAQFLTNCSGSINVEGEKTAPLPAAAAAQILKLKDIVGDDFAVAKSIDKYPLPVMSRNCLENGESKNLWYEEVVPHGSVFYQLTITPDEAMELSLEAEPIQFGGNATIGCGFIRIEKLGGSK